MRRVLHDAEADAVLRGAALEREGAARRGGAVGRRKAYCGGGAARSQGRGGARRARAAAVDVDAAPSDDDDDIDEPIVEEVDRPRCQAPPPPPPPQKPIVVDVTEPKAPVTTQDVRAAGGPPPQKAVWNSKDTWEERDVTAWAVSRFTELLQEEVCQVSPAINLKFRDVLRVVGDAQVVVFQRRTRYLFDFSEVELAWAAETVEGSPLFNGRCIIRDAASGAAAADLELETAFAPATDDEKAGATFCGGAARVELESVGRRRARALRGRVRAALGRGVALAVKFPTSKRLAKR